MPRKSYIALAACAAVLLTTSAPPTPIANAEQLTAKPNKKKAGLLVPAIQKVREAPRRGTTRKYGSAKPANRNRTPRYSLPVGFPSK